MPNQDLLRRNHDLRRRTKAFDIELVVVAQETQQVQAGQVAGAVVYVQILAARIAGVDRPRRWRGVPCINRGLKLHAGISTLPCRLGHIGEDLASGARLDHRPTGTSDQIP